MQAVYGMRCLSTKSTTYHVGKVHKRLLPPTQAEDFYGHAKGKAGEYYDSAKGEAGGYVDAAGNYVAAGQRKAGEAYDAAKGKAGEYADRRSGAAGDRARGACS